MIDYYQILELEFNCDKNQIKKQYHKLCLQYHPDKNNDKNNDKKIKEINEAYSILYDDQKRRNYNIQYIFKNIDLNETDLFIINHYYERIIQSNEYKLFHLLYQSLPKDILTKKKLKKNKLKQMIQSNKKIDITGLNSDEIINFIITKDDYYHKKLKNFDIHTKYGIVPIFIRDFDDKMIINNINCQLIINFIIK
tara:strand:- start:18 stop:602 length:585 start_codon:yes stop_codon:yes gene_type:complete